MNDKILHLELEALSPEALRGLRLTLDRELSKTTRAIKHTAPSANELRTMYRRRETQLITGLAKVDVAVACQI